MSADPLQGVMVGAGYFAPFQAEAWRRVAGVEIVAVADRLPERAQAFAREWGIPRSYPHAEAMLREERPEFVDIVTDPEAHRELTSLAARHGVHVICQKPMAPSWEDCLAMVETCEQAGVRLLMHENFRWQPWHREIRRLLSAGAIGNPFYLGFRIRRGDGRGSKPYPVQPYFREMERFLLQETVVHFLDTFRFLLGEIASVFCHTRRVNPVIRGEDCALVQLTFENGVLGLIDANRISGPTTPEPAFGELRLEGDRGMIRLSPDGRLWFTEYGKAEVEHTFPTSNQGYCGDSIRALQEHFAICLRTGQPGETEGREYLKTVAAVSACYRSAETGQPVPLREAAG